MKKNTALFQKLEQTVARLYTEHTKTEPKKIHRKFDRALFSDDFQSCPFYLNEIHQTLVHIARLEEKDTEALHFFTNKLTAQCNALSEALKTPTPRSKSAVNFKPVLSKREKIKHTLNQLPPRERLAKYYEALQALNEKLEKQTDLYQNAQQEQDKTHYTQQIDITRQRRKRCLDAIELLEEYLEFKEN